MPHFVAIGQTVVTISRLWFFQDGGSHNVGFLKSEWSRRTNCVTMPNSVEIAETTEICQFSIFPRWRPSAILDL